MKMKSQNAEPNVQIGELGCHKGFLNLYLVEKNPKVAMMKKLLEHVLSGLKRGKGFHRIRIIASRRL
jgi:hypothetical protein